MRRAGHDNRGAIWRAAVEVLVLLQVDYLWAVLDLGVFVVAADFAVKDEPMPHAAKVVECLPSRWVRRVLGPLIDVNADVVAVTAGFADFFARHLSNLPLVREFGNENRPSRTRCSTAF